MKWILDHFDDPYKKFEMIAAETKYHSTLCSFAINDQSMKSYLGQSMVEILSEIDINNVSFKQMKALFQYTIVAWEYPKLQKTILGLIDKSRYKELYDRDNLYISL